MLRSFEGLDAGEPLEPGSRQGSLPGLEGTGAGARRPSGTSPPASEPWREALLEVMAARTQVRRFGSNVNQAVRALNSTGEAPDWLDRPSRCRLGRSSASMAQPRTCPGGCGDRQGDALGDDHDGQAECCAGRGDDDKEDKQAGTG